MWCACARAGRLSPPCVSPPCPSSSSSRSDSWAPPPRLPLLARHRQDAPRPQEAHAEALRLRRRLHRALEGAPPPPLCSSRLDRVPDASFPRRYPPAARAASLPSSRLTVPFPPGPARHGGPRRSSSGASSRSSTLRSRRATTGRTPPSRWTRWAQTAPRSAGAMPPPRPLARPAPLARRAAPKPPRSRPACAPRATAGHPDLEAWDRGRLRNVQGGAQGRQAVHDGRQPVRRPRAPGPPQGPARRGYTGCSNGAAPCLAASPWPRALIACPRPPHAPCTIPPHTQSCGAVLRVPSGEHPEAREVRPARPRRRVRAPAAAAAARAAPLVPTRCPRGSTDGGPETQPLPPAAFSGTW